MDPAGAAAEIQHAALLAADPAEAIRRHIQRMADWLMVGDARYHLPEIERVFVVAMGQAAIAMTDAAVDYFDAKIAGGIVVTPSSSNTQYPLPVLIGGHPVPTGNSV